jgi:hypothetical protein
LGLRPVIEEVEALKTDQHSKATSADFICERFLKLRIYSLFLKFSRNMSAFI